MLTRLGSRALDLPPVILVRAGCPGQRKQGARRLRRGSQGSASLRGKRARDAARDSAVTVTGGGRSTSGTSSTEYYQHHHHHHQTDGRSNDRPAGESDGTDLLHRSQARVTRSRSRSLFRFPVERGGAAAGNEGGDGSLIRGLAATCSMLACSVPIETDSRVREPRRLNTVEPNNGGGLPTNVSTRRLGVR